MTEAARIVLDPAVLAGKPIVGGTRISVEFVLGLLAEGWSDADVLENYSVLTLEDIRACLSYAKDVISTEKVFPSAA